MVTADDIKQTVMKMICFADGSDPRHIQICQSVEYPSLTRIWASFKNGRKTMIYFVAHEPVPLKSEPDRHVVLAERINAAVAKNPALKDAMNADINLMIEEARRIVNV